MITGNDSTRREGGVVGPEEPKVAVVILNWNRGQDTTACLESVRSLRYADYETIVVDNGSTDDSTDRIRAWTQAAAGALASPLTEGGDRAMMMETSTADGRWILLETGENLGFAEGNNVAIRRILDAPSPPEYIFLLNNDAVAEPESLREAVRVARRYQASLVGFTVRDKEGDGLQFSGDKRRPELFYRRSRRRIEPGLAEAPSNGVMGCAMLIHRRAIEEHQALYGHFFDPRLFLYGEETEFCLDFLQMGRTIYVAGNAVVRHESGKSLPSETKDAARLYYASRNTILIARHALSGFWLALFHVYYLAGRTKVFVLKALSGKRRESQALAKGVIDGFRGKGGPWKS